MVKPTLGHGAVELQRECNAFKETNMGGGRSAAKQNLWASNLMPVYAKDSDERIQKAFEVAVPEISIPLPEQQREESRETSKDTKENFSIGIVRQGVRRQTGA